jgi:hypothetical protein
LLNADRADGQVCGFGDSLPLAAAPEVKDIALVITAGILQLCRRHVARDQNLVFLAVFGDVPMCD